MKKNKNLIKILILAAVIFILGCNQNFFPNNDTTTKVEETTNAGYGSVRINIKNSDPSILSQIMPIGMRKFNTRTIMPDLSTDNIVYYDLTGDGPSDASFDLINLTITGDYTVNNLEVGAWTITVTGKDEFFNVVARGSSPVSIVNGETANATVNVSPVKTATGKGTIDVSVDWDPAITVSAVNSTLRIDGVSSFLFSISENHFTYFNNSLDSGYYTIIISLKDASFNLLATLVETIYVYDNLTTYWKKSLTANEINAPPAAPTGLTITEGSGKLILNWNDISDVETGYKIYSKIDLDPYILLAEIPAGAVGYEDTSATPGNISYQTIAYNDFGESAPLEAIYNLASPIVSEALNPADGATDVDVTTDIKIRFNKSMDLSITGEIILFDGVSDQTLNAANAYFIFSTTTLTNDTLTVISKSPAPYGITCSNIRVINFKDLFGTSSNFSDASYDFTFKAAPPKFALGYPRINNITGNSFCIDAIADTTGKVSYKILPKGSPEPSSSEIFNSSTGNYDVTANTLSRKVVTTGVAANQEYDVYIICSDVSDNISSVFKFIVKTPATSDVLFSEDFEDESGDYSAITSGYFIPSGNANSKWDKYIFNASGRLTFANINTAAVTGGSVTNGTKKFAMKLSSFGTPVLFGAAFSSAIKKFIVVEYDYFVNGSSGWKPSNDLIISDGTNDLNGSGTNKIAVHIKNTPPTGSGPINFTLSENNNILSPSGSDNSTSLSWSSGKWYKIQVIIDQFSKKFYIKLINVDFWTISTTPLYSYNDTLAGNIQKVWFGCSDVNELYIDNISIYQTDTDPGSAPMIEINKKDAGIVNTNPYIDVDFFSSLSLTLIQYKIGETGSYQPLTTDGINQAFPGGSIFNTDVKILNTDFNNLPQGPSKIYFKATNSGGYSAESQDYFTIFKDTMPPQIKTATIAPDNSFVKLDFSEKVWGNASMSESITSSDIYPQFYTFGSVNGALIEGIFANPALTEPLNPLNEYDSVFVKITTTPAGNKPDGTETFSIKSGAGAIFDRLGNSGPGTESPIITFNDKKPPAIIYKNPENLGTTGLDADLIFTFDEAVSAGAGKYIYIKKVFDNSTFRSFLATDPAKVIINSNQVNLIVDGYFGPNTEYYVTMDAGAFADAKGNYSIGYSDNSFWKFSSDLNYTSLVKVTGGTYFQTEDGLTGFDHTVSDFYIGKYEVTYQLWYDVRTWSSSKGYTFANMGQEGNDGTTDYAPTANNYEPVTSINWRDAIVWCNAYSEKMGLVPVYKDRTTDFVIKDSSNATSCDTAVCDWNANGYRLPTEGEWQYTASWKGSDSSNGAIEYPVSSGKYWTPWNYLSGASGDYTNNSASFTVGVFYKYSDLTNTGVTKTANVGTKQPNQLGIYDMSGNINEFCWDWYSSYPGADQTNYRGPLSASQRIIRGGAWGVDVNICQTGWRNATGANTALNTFGFRLARSTESAYWGSFIWKAALWGN